MSQHPESHEMWHHSNIWHHGWIPMDAPYARTKNQWFTSDVPHSRSSFKKLIVSTPRLLRNLHTISLVKAVPDGLKDHKYKKIDFCKCPPIPYIPKEGLCSREGLCLQGQPSQDADWQRHRTTSSYLALWDSQGISHSHGICPRSNQEKGITQVLHGIQQDLHGGTAR